MPPRARVTQLDVARQVGCDKSAVSLALHNSPAISAELRAKIKAAADQLGYRPDPALSSLLRQRWAGRESGSGATLAYLVHTAGGSVDLQLRHFEAARDRAESVGYRLVKFDLSNYAAARSAGKILFNRGIRGLLVPTLPPGTVEWLRELDFSAFAVVSASFGWAVPPWDAVNPDYFEATRLAWRHCMKAGYRRIGAAIFAHVPSAVDDDSRHAACLLEQQSADSTDAIPVLRCRPNDAAAFAAWYDRYRPSAVLSTFAKARLSLEARGVHIPRDTAFAALNVAPGGFDSGICLQISVTATAAADWLMGKVHANEFGLPRHLRRIAVEPQWNEGQSLPAIHRDELRVG